MSRGFEFIQCGTGTSAGVPVIGCQCNVCTSDDPHDARTRCGACIRFTDPSGHERVILIDVPPDHRQHSLALGLNRCDLILLTHDHVDHVFGLDEVRRYNAIMKQPIEVRAEESTLTSIKRIFKHVFSKHENVNDSFVADLRSKALTIGEPIERFGLRIEPLRVLHGKLEILGFRVDAIDPSSGLGAGVLPLAYLTDCSEIPPETWPRLEGLQTLILDMLRFRQHPTHFTVDEAVSAGSKIGAKATWFIHMTHDIIHADLDIALPPGMHLAYDGLSLAAKP